MSEPYVVQLEMNKSVELTVWAESFEEAIVSAEQKTPGHRAVSIESQYGVGFDIAGKCEGCMKALLTGDRYAIDCDSDLRFCTTCAQECA